MNFTHIPAHTENHPDRFEDENTGIGYEVSQDGVAEDPRGCIEDENAALWAYSQPRHGSSVAADLPTDNVAITAFARYFEYFDDTKSLELTKRYLAVFHQEKKLTVETHNIKGYSQGDWLDLVIAVADGYGTPESHANEFRMWAYGDVWTVVPDKGEAVSGIYADSAREALDYFLPEHGGQVPEEESLEGEPRFAYVGFHLDDSTDAIEEKYLIDITDRGEEIATIVHRASVDYPLDGPLAKAKLDMAEHLVALLNNDAAQINVGDRVEHVNQPELDSRRVIARGDDWLWLDFQQAEFDEGQMPTRLPVGNYRKI